MPSRFGDKVNILTIMSDQHSRRVLGCYGDPLVRTPNLDALAADGMRFSDAYCPAPLCVPSRMSFMTSRTPGRNRVWNNAHVLSSGIPTWAHILGASGYETALIGRMHFVGADQRHGFARRPAGEFGSQHPGVPVHGGPMWQHFPGSTCGQCREGVEIAGCGHTHYQWCDETYTEAARRYLREYAAGRQERPFAAVLGYFLPHCPYIALKELFDYYYDRVTIPTVEAVQPEDIRRFRADRDILRELPEERIRVARAAYFGLVEHLDRLIGTVLACLEETGLAENTLVVYCSDHGEMAGEHGCWWKSCYYEDSAGVPLIARLPGRIAAGTVCDAVCGLADLGVTYADLAGAPFKPCPDGHSLLPLLAGERPATWPNRVFSELVDSRGLLPSRMIRRDRWKLWLTASGPEAEPVLFDLAQDPGELHNLAGDPRYVEVKARLLQELCQEWDPEVARTGAADGDESYQTLCRWGETVHPEHPDVLTMPSADYEADVERR